jgi:peptidoglycan-associated lipoprotein
MFARALTTSFVALFLIVGCSSNKPKNSQDDAAAVGAEGNNEGLSLELNGSSDTGKAGGLRTAYFSYDSSAIEGDTKATIEANAEFLKKMPNVDIQVEGHADERGGRQYNLALGERRAKAVRDHLVAMGIPAKRISVISYGSERPASEGSDESSWSKNRRANFVVTAK